MGPLLFCLALQPALLVIKDRVDSLTYMDDIYLIGEENKMASALITLKEHLPKLGLEVNLKKSWATIRIKWDDKTLIRKNKDPMIMKTPLNFAKKTESLSPKVVDQIRAISKIVNVQVVSCC